jgi:uncharacterized membrane protein YphA (DoxX/SURF4 family)
MGLDTQTAPISKPMLWTGWIMSALPALMLLLSGVGKFMKPEVVVKEMTRLGWDESFLLSLGIVEIICTVLFVIPQTAVLGAILLTGYLGGVIATHVPHHDNFIFPIVLGMLIWGGLFLRDVRLRALLPLRR